VAEGRRRAGKILGLLELIEEHRSALRYDWRTRFHKGLDESVPDEIGWSEALDLVKILRADPASMLAAAMEGWDHPISREALILMDQFDLDMAVNAGKKKPKPYPRPWKTSDKTTQRHGNAGGRSRAEVARILNAHGHNLPV